MVELKGSLSGIGLPAIVQLLGELRETGRLRLSNDRWAAELTFEDGLLVAASFGRERGLNALAASVLTLTDGEFVFLDGGGPAEHNIELTPDELRVHLAELGARRGGIDVPIPSLDAVPRLATGGEESAPGEHVVLERSAVQMLLLVDGARTVREIVGDRPLLPAMRDLALLLEQGLISVPEPTPPTQPPTVIPREPPVRLVPPASLAEPTLEQAAMLGACPRLGFADDPARHYSRPTALHRCYAAGAAGLVTSQEQRELCLNGRFSTCPRFRAAGDAPTPALVEPVEPETVVVRRPGPPPGVVARLAAAEQMVAAAPPAQEPYVAEVAPESWRDRLGRGPLLIAGGVLLGLLLLGTTIALLPMLQQAPVAPAATPAPAFAPVLTAPPSPAARPTLTPPPATARPPTPTAPALPKPTAGSAPAGRERLDTRFTGASQEGWLDNPPFVNWRDGAYRLAARQIARFLAVGAPLEAVGDAVVSATLRKTGGPPGGGYGVIVRDQGPEPRDGSNQSMRAYVFEAGDLGEFGVWRRDGDRWVDLVPWTPSSVVRQGGSPNELTVRIDGDVMTFSINGVEVATVEDSELPAQGKVGVFVGGDFNEVALDRFAVHVPD